MKTKTSFYCFCCFQSPPNYGIYLVQVWVHVVGNFLCTSLYHLTLSLVEHVDERCGVFVFLSATFGCFALGAHRSLTFGFSSARTRDKTRSSNTWTCVLIHRHLIWLREKERQPRGPRFRIPSIHFFPDSMKYVIRFTRWPRAIEQDALTCKRAFVIMQPSVMHPFVRSSASHLSFVFILIESYQQHCEISNVVLSHT